MSAATIRSFALSRRSLLGVLHWLLTYWDMPSRKKYILHLLVSRLSPLPQPLLSILGCAAMYTDLALRHTCSLIKHAKASGPLHRAYIWYPPPYPISAGYHGRVAGRNGILSHMAFWAAKCSMRLISTRPMLSTVLVDPAALVLWSCYFLFLLSQMINAEFLAALACHHLVDWVQAISWQSTCMESRISSKVRTFLDSSISSWTLNFLPDLSSAFALWLWSSYCTVRVI